MIPVTTFADKKVAVFGLGGSGLLTAKALKAGRRPIYLTYRRKPRSVTPDKIAGS